MARFRAPSVSSADTLHSTATRRTTQDQAPVENRRCSVEPEERNTHHAPSRRSKASHRAKKKRSGMSAHKKRQINMSRKSAHKKAGIRRSKVYQICPSSVYVGNLMPTVTEKLLQRLFATCGKIDTIELRCSQGRGVIPGLSLTDYFSTDRAYATVTFTTPTAAEKALKFNSCVLHHVRIVVSLNAVDLPEVDFIMKERLAIMTEMPYHPRGPEHRQATQPNLDRCTHGHCDDVSARRRNEERVSARPTRIPFEMPVTPKPITRNLFLGISLYTTII